MLTTPIVELLNLNELEVSPVYPTEEDIVSNFYNSPSVNGVLEEELPDNVSFSDDEGILLDNNESPYISPLGLIGTNDRRVRNTSTTIHPYNAITYLYLRWPNGETGRCTGFIIDRDSVLTAGHCIYSSSNGGWADRITVRPGANGVDNFPYGAFESKNLYSVTGWTKDEDRDYDYGVINIDGTFPSTIGSFGYGVATSSNFSGKFARITGYPADRSGVDSTKPLYTQWYHSGTTQLPLLNSRLVLYDADTSGGQSGSPVYIPSENIARAIHTGVYSSSLNRGTRITDSVFANIQSWASK